MAFKLSTAEKVYLALRLTLLTPFHILTSLIRSFILSLSRGLPPRLFWVCAVLRVVLGTFSARQIQYLSNSTKTTYETWMRRMISKEGKEKTSGVAARLKIDIENLDDSNASLLWVGDRQRAKKFVLFFHGGGYISPLLPGHLEWCWRAYVAAGIETGVETAVAILQYSLCPDARHPVQLSQAIYGLSRLFRSGIKPCDVIIGGDSAGGHLAAQLLCHFCQPHPDLEPVRLSGPLAGCFLVSPWLTSRTSDPSFTENGSIDMLSASIVDKSTKYLLGCTSTRDDQNAAMKLAFPLDMEEFPFKGLKSILKQLYITTGEHEVFRDQALTLAERIERSEDNVELRLDIQQRQAHDFILLEGQEERNGECIEAMKAWMKNLLLRDTMNSVRL
ncbi:Alpha/Beta hydrolase protein [Dactylonectria macrodidyma]|uniref:Alpha/Beta hydrolase protein n=1 Tax=Dactylonectria macrodidyma TaxID=307937 RepID=A0A9P9E253_9HYPO|nr:Alpha/Beta hydrolase protein [Dactylonectria macrodidyma]